MHSTSQDINNWKSSHEISAADYINSVMAQEFADWIIQQKHHNAAIAIIVWKAVFLRLREVIALQWRYVIFPGDARIQDAVINTAAVVVDQSKTAKPGELQLEFITSLPAVAVIRIL